MRANDARMEGKEMVGMWLKSPMVGSLELSLVFFTVLTQMAVGALAFLFVTRLTKKEQVISADVATLTKRVVFISLVAVIIGSLIALAHVGHAVRTYRALVYHLSSWMGKEALFLALFTLSLLIYASLLAKGSGAKIGFEVFASITGILGVLSSSLLYAILGSVPSWNNIFTVIYFFLSLLFLGGSLFAAIIVLKLKSNEEAVKNLAESYLGTFASIFTPLLIGAVVVTAGYLFYLGSGGREAKETLSTMTGSIIFWLRIVVGFLAPLVLIVLLKKMISKGEAATKSLSYVAGVFGLLFIGEILGRLLFFATSAMHTIGGTGTPY